MSTTEGLWLAQSHTWLAVEAHCARVLQHTVYCITVTMYTGHEILSHVQITPHLLPVHSFTAFNHNGSKVMSLHSLLAALCMLICLACIVQLHQRELWPLLSHRVPGAEVPRVQKAS